MNVPHRDRSLALGVVGALEILAGIGLLGLTALLALALADTAALQRAGVQAGALVLSAGIYGALAIAAIVVGIGLIACRRWARALSLIAAWAMAILGGFLAVTYAVLMPTIMRAIPAPPGQGPVPVAVVTIASILFAVIVLLVPGALVAWVLGGDDVRLTCEWRDRAERWTDRCPLPVLAMSLMYGFAALALLPTGLTTPALVAGRVLTGAPALAFYAAAAIVMGVLAAGLYRLKPWAWLGAVAVTILGFVNAATVLREGVLDDVYRAMGMPEEQVRLSLGLLSAPGMLFTMGLSMAGVAAWLLLIRKHFRSHPT